MADTIIGREVEQEILRQRIESDAKYRQLLFCTECTAGA